LSAGDEGDEPIMGAIAWALKSVRKRGLLRTAKVATSVIADLSFDWRYGTDTTRWVLKDDLRAVGENKIHSVCYQPTKARPLRNLLNSLDLPRDSGFVDLGSGKGRVWLVAAQCGFQRIIGVEFSPELCESTRQNVEIFRRRFGLTARIDIVMSDAAHYRIQPDQSIFFMYNPFDGVVMEQVMANIRRSVELAPRQVWLIYNTPKCQETIEKAGIFRERFFREIGGTDFLVCTNTGQTGTKGTGPDHPAGKWGEPFPHRGGAGPTSPRADL
jgi:predicted RNA methylase